MLDAYGSGRDVCWRELPLDSREEMCMTRDKVLLRAVVMAAVMATVLLGGCRVETGGEGRGDKVPMATPFGGLQVKTDERVQAGVGLPIYAGAQLVKKEGGKDSGAADVNLSFGRFQLRVRALSYRTGDEPEKVKAFYKKELGRYGDVIECVGDQPVGARTRTAEGFTCGKSKGSGAVIQNGGSKSVELKAGSEQHAHVVGIEPEGSGTKFALVMLDLPGPIQLGNDDSAPKQ